MKQYFDFWKNEFWMNYVNFNGCTSRRNFWVVVLINVIVAVVVGIVSSILHFSVLSSLYSLAVLVPNLAITVRRLRDAGKAWGWIFIAFVPVVGGIWLLVLLCRPSAASVEVQR